MPTENTKVLVVLDRHDAERLKNWAYDRTRAPYADGFHRRLFAAIPLDAEQEERVEYSAEVPGGCKVHFASVQSMDEWQKAASRGRDLSGVRRLVRTITQLPDGGQYVGPWVDLDDEQQRGEGE